MIEVLYIICFICDKIHMQYVVFRVKELLETLMVSLYQYPLPIGQQSIVLYFTCLSQLFLQYHYLKTHPYCCHIPTVKGIHRNMKCCGVCSQSWQSTCTPAHPWLAYLSLARAKRFFAWRISVDCSCYKFGASVDVAVNCDFNCGFNCGSKTFTSCKLCAASEQLAKVPDPQTICAIYRYTQHVYVRVYVCALWRA